MRRILVVAAHPDDAEFGAGGCIARWAEQGDRVAYVICTNGDKGSSDPAMTSEKLAALREKEQKAAARVLGVTEVVFLGYPDGDLEYTRESRGKVVRAIREYRPDLLLTTDPYRRFPWHHDHRICGQIALDAVFPYARDRLSYPEHLAEGLSTHAVREVYLWGSETPDTFIDITDKFDKKMQALKCHTSQVGHRPEPELRERVAGRLTAAGQRIGVRYAEAFLRIELNM